MIYSTAEWTKFSPTVLNALNEDDIKYRDREALETISKRLNLNIPTQISELFSSPVIHDSVINIKDLEKKIIVFLK